MAIAAWHPFRTLGASAVRVDAPPSRRSVRLPIAEKLKEPQRTPKGAAPRPFGEARDRAFCDLAQEGLELREGFFDGVHVGTVRGQISQLGSRRLNELLNPWSLVARQIVHHDDVAFRERGNETFFHPFLEGCRIH